MIDIRSIADEISDLLQGDKKRLTRFRALMLNCAEMTMREAFTANDTNLLHAYRGQMRCFTELADRTKDALDTLAAKANADGLDGTRLEGLR